jgi:hypothetical protein
MATQARLMTAEDLLQLPDDGFGNRACVLNV